MSEPFELDFLISSKEKIIPAKFWGHYGVQFEIQFQSLNGIKPVILKSLTDIIAFVPEVNRKLNLWPVFHNKRSISSPKIINLARNCLNFDFLSEF